MSKTYDQLVASDAIDPDDVIEPKRGETFYLPDYGKFTFQFPAPPFADIYDEDCEQSGGMSRSAMDAALEDVIAFGKVADAAQDMNAISVADKVRVLVTLYRRLDAYIQLWAWTLRDSDECLAGILSDLLKRDAPDINVPAPSRGDALSALAHLLAD